MLANATIHDLVFIRKVVWSTEIPIKALAKQSTTFANGRALTQAKKKKFQNLVSKFAEINKPKELIQGFIELQVVIVFPYTKKDRKKALKTLTPFKLCDKRPDFDNLSKPICDALSEICYRDDAQVSIGRIIKMRGFQPLIFIQLSTVTLE